MDHLLNFVAHSVIYRGISTWFREMPTVVQVGLVAAAVAVVLFGGPVVGGARSRLRGRLAYGKRDGRRRS